MTTTITRLLDGAVLPTFSDGTSFEVNMDAYGFSNTQTGVTGDNGELIQLSSALNQKQFSVKWAVGTTVSDTLNQIRMFFTDPGLYELTDDDYGLVKVWASVDDVDADYGEITVNFTSRYGDLVTELTSNLSTQYMNGGEASEAIDTTFTNSWNVDAKVRVMLVADRHTNWKAGTKVTLTQLPFVIAEQDDYGNWNQTQRRKSIVFDTSRLILGRGYFRAYGTQFWRIRPGQSTEIKLPSITNPLVSGATGWSLVVDVVGVSRGGAQ